MAQHAKAGIVRGAGFSEAFDRKVGTKHPRVRLGLGYGNSSKALLMFKAAFIHTRAASGLLNGEGSLDATDLEKGLATCEDAESTDSVWDMVGLGLKELLHSH